MFYGLPYDVNEYALGRFLGRWGTVTCVRRFTNQKLSVDRGDTAMTPSVNVSVEFATQEDARAVFERGRKSMIGFQTGFGRPSLFSDYGEDNKLRVRHGWGEGSREKEVRTGMFRWVYVHGWTGTREELEREFEGVAEIERVLVGE